MQLQGINENRLRRKWLRVFLLGVEEEFQRGNGILEDMLSLRKLLLGTFIEFKAKRQSSLEGRENTQGGELLTQSQAFSI